MCRTTFCSLNPTELACSDHKQLRNVFDAYVTEALGPADTISDFDYKEYTDLNRDLDYMRMALKEFRTSLHYYLPSQNLMTNI